MHLLIRCFFPVLSGHKSAYGLPLPSYHLSWLCILQILLCSLRTEYLRFFPDRWNRSDDRCGKPQHCWLLPSEWLSSAQHLPWSQGVLHCQDVLFQGYRLRLRHLYRSWLFLRKPGSLLSQLWYFPQGNALHMTHGSAYAFLFSFSLLLLHVCSSHGQGEHRHKDNRSGHCLLPLVHIQRPEGGSWKLLRLLLVYLHLPPAGTHVPFPIRHSTPAISVLLCELLLWS